MSANPDSIDLCRLRGDTFPMEFTVKDSSDVVVDITGATFLLTVDPNPDPTDALANLFQIAGVITDAVNGVFTVTPNATQMDQSPDVYFYDLEMIDGAGLIRTIAKGKFEIQQDITK